MVSNHPQAVFLPRFVPHVFNLTRNRHCTSNTISCQQCSTSTPELMFTTVSDPAPTTMAQSRSLSPMSTTSDRPMPPSRTFPFLFPDVHNIGSFYSAPITFANPMSTTSDPAFLQVNTGRVCVSRSESPTQMSTSADPIFHTVTLTRQPPSRAPVSSVTLVQPQTTLVLARILKPLSR